MTIKKKHSYIESKNLIPGHASSTFGWYLGGREGYPRIPGIEKIFPEMNRSRGVQRMNEAQRCGGRDPGFSTKKKDFLILRSENFL